MIYRTVGFVVIALLLIAGLVYSQQRPEAITVSGFIEADEIRLGSRVGGRVHEVYVDEGEYVEEGELLLVLEPFDLRERRAEAEAIFNQRMAAYELLMEGYRDEEVAQAQARYDQAAANLLLLQNGPREQELRTAQAELDLAVAELDLAQVNHDRNVELHQEGAASQKDVDRTFSELRTATELVNARREQLELRQEGTRSEEISIAEAQTREAESALELLMNGYRSQDVDEAYQAMKAAQSALAAIDQQLVELEVKAPVSGAIEALELEPGELISPNAPVISLVDSSALWVRAYVPENQLDLALGQRVSVTIDSYPGEMFEGEVTFIARQAEFTPSNVQTSEERSKQVFRIKVTLLEGHDRLRPGMAADIWLEGEP